MTDAGQGAVMIASHPCHCCGREGYILVGFGGGRRIHFDCWDEHHSDPTTEWPVGHVCKMETKENDS